MSIWDIDAHPPLEAGACKRFYEDLSRLGIEKALGAPLAEGLTPRECNLRVPAASERPSLWGHPDCRDQVERAALLTVDASWLSESEEILRLGEEKEIPVLLRHETAEEARRVAKSHPRLALIVGGLDSRIGKPAVMAELMAELPRVYLNLSGAVWGYNYVVHEWIGRLPVDRILFGSAYPLGNPAAKLGALRWELRDTDPSVAESILEGNARALLQEGF